jgi:transcription initiation factor TFIIIB Brf1 subunit/transcription initiation factor TFIIB
MTDKNIHFYLLQINIFDLGRTLNFLSRSLFIKLPPTDPCIYVLRFSVMLDLGDKQNDVSKYFLIRLYNKNK